MYNKELIEKCQKLCEAKRIVVDPLYKKIKEQVYIETVMFPEKISYANRIKAIAENNPCTCKHCGAIHGLISKTFCSQEHRIQYKKQHGYSFEEANQRAKERTINAIEAKFKDKIEGYDYLICKICGRKLGDLSTHVINAHNMNPSEYKKQYNVESMKPMRKRELVQGERNPAYKHEGRYSAWSKNFIHGYDQDRHEKHKKQHKEWIKQNSDKHVTNIQYWLKQTNGDQELAEKLYKQSQTRDLNWFINKYGEEEGIKRHKAKTEKWIKTLNSKSIEELREINAKKVKKSGCFYSKDEKELFFKLKEVYLELTDQYAICKDDTAEKKKFYLYDMFYDNKIIEFNGDFWHANPEKYDKTFINPYTKKLKKKLLHEMNINLI